MFGGSLLGSNSSSPIPPQSPSADHQSDGLSSQSPPCWATQARCDLAQAEADLRRQQERYATEIQSVKRGVERAILGARREERRLLERVEQDHRDTQQNLEQVQRENMAAARVSQSLLDQRLRKLSKLQQQIQDVGQSGLNQCLLMKEVSEFLQPWEISVSLKKVNFKPSSQPNAVSFGDIRVAEQSLCLHGGGCGPQGQLCALHSQENQSGDVSPQSPGDEKNNAEQGWTSPTGRVVRKISLSNRTDLESVNEPKLSASKQCPWQSDWESSQDDEMDSAPFETHREDVFLAVPKVVKSRDSESKAQVNRVNSNGKNYSPRNQRKPLSIVSGRKSSLSPERRQDHAKLSPSRSLESQDGNKGRKEVSQDSYGRFLKYDSSGLTSPKMSAREPLTSQSCLDLTSRGRPHSCLSQSSDEHSLGTLGDSGRAPSPADSLDSSYTFIVSSSNDHANASKASLNYSCRLSRSAVDLSRKTRPPVSLAENDNIGVWKVKCNNFNSRSSSSSNSPTLSRAARASEKAQSLSYSSYRGPNTSHQPRNQNTAAGPIQPLVARSLSMSVIDGSSHESSRGRERGQPALRELEEEGDSSFTGFHPTGVHLIRQFGKQGSGRADLTLPSGIHATPQGQLFIVDCGNARIQVTDPRGNVLQQVTSQASGSTRRCRNYFDIAVNAKGLIALSCAAERALLIFSRHGRLLQTYGGSGSGSAKDELEAPRGVTVTRMDEFLVADIRKGTLIALKLDPKTGCRLERTVVTGFHRPYLVAACLSSGMMAVSERGSETGRVACIKVLEPGWNTIRVLGVCAGMGPVLVCPWGICIDSDGNVLVADWGEHHRVLLFPARGVGWPVVTQGLSSPRGLTLLPEGHLAVSDSMHHCIKIYQYKPAHD